MYRIEHALSVLSLKGVDHPKGTCPTCDLRRSRRHKSLVQHMSLRHQSHHDQRSNRKILFVSRKRLDTARIVDRLNLDMSRAISEHEDDIPPTTSNIRDEIEGLLVMSGQAGNTILYFDTNAIGSMNVASLEKIFKTASRHHTITVLIDGPVKPFQKVPSDWSGYVIASNDSRSGHLLSVLTKVCERQKWRVPLVRLVIDMKRYLPSLSLTATKGHEKEIDTAVFAFG